MAAPPWDPSSCSCSSPSRCGSWSSGRSRRGAGGIIGTLTVVGESEVTLATGPGIELQVVRGAVSRRLDPPAPPTDEVEVDGPGDGEG